MKLKVAVSTIFFIALFTAVGLCSTAMEAHNLFYQGNASYSNEDFEDAVRQYEDVLRMGYESGALYYNLGNAYFNSGKLGKAIANYLRAQRLMPNDADLSSNLNYARSLIKEGVVAPKGAWPRRLFSKAVDSFSLDGITLFATYIYFSLAAVSAVFILVRNLRPKLNYLIFFLSLFLLFSIAVGVAKFNDVVLESKAVIIAEESESRFEPFDDATIFFRLNEGETVIIMDLRDGWLKVKRPDGRQGWIKSEAVESL